MCRWVDVAMYEGAIILSTVFCKEIGVRMETLKLSYKLLTTQIEITLKDPSNIISVTGGLSYVK